MSLQRSEPGTNGYRPTSLDFINRPNPVEPSNVGSHGTSGIDNRQISRGSDEQLIRVLLGARARDSATDSRVTKSSNQSVSSGSIAAVLNDDDEPITLARHAESDQALFKLPQLPVKRGVKRTRHRVPPVLQGLHQPPPNAGLLPSINTESVPVDPNTAVDRVVQSAPEHYVFANRPSDAANQPQSDAARPSPKNKWTDEETAELVKGVRRFGIGKWKQILNCSDLHFNNRSTVDLKDRFRLWTRQQDKLGRPIHGADASHPTSDTASFAASQRRHRVNWTEAEDEALLQGFRKYGASWTSIQISPVLTERTPTDVRDRLRIRYPDEYKKTGLAAKHRKQILRSSDTAAQPLKVSEKADAGQTVPGSRATIDFGKSKPANIFSAFDEEWFADLDLPEDEPIVLDRSIMDWAANRQLPSLESVLAAPPPDLGNMQGIDPLSTLLPRPSQ